MQLKCPNCGSVFSVDDDACANLLQQLRDQEFQKELNAQKQILESAQKSEQKAKEEALTLSVRKESQEKINTLTSEISDLTQKYEQEISDLKTKLSSARADLGIAQKDTELAVAKAVSESDARHAKEENDLQTQLDYYKNLKVSMSTKEVGESLEQYCMSEFNKLRAAAYRNASFEKDNEVSKESGSKGDFIFRDYTDDGIEYISIMFDMKNEMDTTASKHKNEDFFKELDKDRNEKHCEYAVLVSMLEADNDFYNTGIVDVSYRYPKMYVVRPQFFMTIIAILRNAATDTIESKRQIAQYQAQNLDFIRLEDNMKDFQDSVSHNAVLFHKQFDQAVSEIDKSIAHLQKVKDDLLSSDRNLKLLEDKTEKLSVKELTKGAPSMKEEYDRQKKNLIEE